MKTTLHVSLIVSIILFVSTFVYKETLPCKEEGSVLFALDSIRKLDNQYVYYFTNINTKEQFKILNMTKDSLIFEKNIVINWSKINQK